MKNFNDERLNELLAGHVRKILETGADVNEDYDPGYNLYVVFRALGDIILANEGVEVFRQYLSEIYTESDDVMKPGEIIKIILDIEVIKDTVLLGSILKKGELAAERVWCEIVNIEDATMTVKLRNDSVLNPELKFGTELELIAPEIIDYMPKG